MRDQDIADVIVSPGVWDRDSDVLYEELLNVGGQRSLVP